MIEMRIRTENELRKRAALATGALPLTTGKADGRVPSLQGGSLEMNHAIGQIRI